MDFQSLHYFYRELPEELENTESLNWFVAFSKASPILEPWGHLILLINKTET